jgi:hypothetical protein
MRCRVSGFPPLLKSVGKLARNQIERTMTCGIVTHDVKVARDWLSGDQ